MLFLEITFGQKRGVTLALPIGSNNFLNIDNHFKFKKKTSLRLKLPIDVKRTLFDFLKVLKTKKYNLKNSLEILYDIIAAYFFRVSIVLIQTCFL